jgi:hypothetical protein
MYEFVSLLMYTSKENKNEEFIAQMLFFRMRFILVNIRYLFLPCSEWNE